MGMINDQIKLLIDKQLNTYKDSARIQQDKNNENDFKKSYRYREVLELIQNCIDEFDDSSSNNDILINLQGNVFEIYNTGTPFLTEGIRSLMIANVSPKKDKKYYRDSGYIGNKGLGFRSVLNWANNIKILSNNGLSIEFNQHNSNQFYESNNLFGDFAVFSYPKDMSMEVEDIKKELGHYSTRISLILFEDKFDDVSNQLNSIDHNTLLFLPKINTLKIRINDQWKTFTKITEKNIGLDYEDVIIEYKDSFEIIKTESYRVFETMEQSIRGETINIKVSYHPEIDVSNNPLYSYFKLGINLPIKWKINANFELSEEREKIKKTELNRKILERMIIFLFECAEKEAALISPTDFTILSSLIPDLLIFNEDNLSIIVPKSQIGTDESFYFTNYYKREILKYKLLPLLNETYTSYIDEPTSFQSSLIKILSFDDNIKQKTIKEPIPEIIQAFIKTTLIKHIDFELVNNHLKENIENYENRIELAILFFIEFKDWLDRQSRYDQTLYQELPNFFQNSEGKIIPNGDIFYSTQQNNLVIPSYVSIDFIDSNNIDFILESLNYPTGTRLYATTFGKIFGFHEYVFKSILSSTNSALKSQNDYDDSFREYILFLMSADRKERENKEHEFYLLNRNNELNKSINLYLGFEYDNKKLDELYVNQNDLFIKDITNLGFSQKELISLFIELGASLQPRKIPNNEKFTYGNYVHPYLQYIPTHYLNESIIYPYLTDITYYSFDRYMDILENASNSNIIRWLLSILNNIEEDDTTVGFKWGSKITPRQIMNLPSYFFHQVRTSKWYIYNNRKYSLNQIILYKNLENRCDNLLGISEEELFAGNIEVHKDLRDKFKRVFHIKNDFSDLPDDELYTLLNSIDMIDSNGQISKKIYLDIETNKKDSDIPKPSHGLEEFFNNGKIYCYDNLFHSIKNKNPNNKVYYANKYVLKSIENKRNLMFYSRRKNSTIIKNWFNVDLLDQNVNVTEPKINLFINHEFQQEIEDIKKYVLAIRMNETTTEATHQQARNKNNFRIYPCCEINNEENVFFEDFEFCKSGNDYYIKIPNNYVSVGEVRKNSTYCSSIAEIIQTAHDLKDDFRDKIIKLIPFDEDNRKEQFKVEYNDDTLLKNIELEYITDAEKLLSILNELGFNPSENEKIKLNNVIIEDYKIKERKSIEILVDILKKYGKTANDYNNIGRLILDFTQINQEQFLEYAQQNEKKYISYLFRQDEINESNFYHHLNEYYEAYSSYIAKNTFEYTVESEFVIYFDIDPLKWNNTDIVDFDGITKTNISNYDLEKYKQLEIKFKPEEIKVYAQFGKLDDLFNQLHVDQPKNNVIATKPEENYYSLFQSVMENGQVIVDTDDYEKAEIKDANSRKPKNPTPRIYESEYETNQITGFIAEAEAFKYLISTEKDYETIEWISGNAVKAKKTINGDDNAGYDIRMRLKNGNYKYFEVKGSTEDFYKIEITTNEIEKGQRHPKDYSVIFVKVNITEKKAEYIKPLGNIFDFKEGETLIKNDKFAVKAKAHTLFFKKSAKQ